MGSGHTAGQGTTGCPHILQPPTDHKAVNRNEENSTSWARKRSPTPSAVSSSALYWQPTTVHTEETRIKGPIHGCRAGTEECIWSSETMNGSRARSMQLKVSLTVYLVAWQNNGFSVGLLNHSKMPEFPLCDVNEAIERNQQRSGSITYELHSLPSFMLSPKDTPFLRHWVKGVSANLENSVTRAACWTFLVVPWLRIHLPMQGTQVWSLVEEGPWTTPQGN